MWCDTQMMTPESLSIKLNSTETNKCMDTEHTKLYCFYWCECMYIRNIKQNCVHLVSLFFLHIFLPGYVKYSSIVPAVARKKINVQKLIHFFREISSASTNTNFVQTWISISVKCTQLIALTHFIPVFVKHLENCCFLISGYIIQHLHTVNTISQC